MDSNAQNESRWDGLTEIMGYVCGAGFVLCIIAVIAGIWFVGDKEFGKQLAVAASLGMALFGMGRGYCKLVGDI